MRKKHGNNSNSGSGRLQEKTATFEIHQALKERHRKRRELKRRRDSKKERIPYYEEGSVE